MALMLMISRKARAPELRMITYETPIEMIKHHSNRGQTLDQKMINSNLSVK